MTEGTLVHFVMEHQPKLGLDGAMAKAREPKLGEIAPEEWQLIRAEEAVRAIINSPGMVHAVIACSELEFELPFKVGNKKVTIRGKIDAIGTYSGEKVAFEYKRVSVIDSRTMENLQINNQSQFYRKALAFMGIEIQAVVYVFVSVPKSTPKKALAPELVRYKINGEPYANQQLVDETMEEYKERTHQWYVEHPDAVQIYVDQRSESSMKDFNVWLTQVIKDMIRCVKEKRFYRNSDSCRMRSCSYSSVCLNDCPEIRQANFMERVVQQESTVDVAEMEF